MKQVVAQNLKNYIEKSESCFPGGCGATTCSTTWAAPTCGMVGGCPASAPAAAPATSSGGDSAAKIKKELEKAEKEELVKKSEDELQLCNCLSMFLI